MLLGVVTFLGIASLTAGLWTPYSPSVAVGPSLAGPSWSHWFGTDELGRDVFVRVVYGLRLSILVAMVAALIAGFFGTAFGILFGIPRRMGGLLPDAID